MSRETRNVKCIAKETNSLSHGTSIPNQIISNGDMQHVLLYNIVQILALYVSRPFDVIIEYPNILIS